MRRERILRAAEVKKLKDGTEIELRDVRGDGLRGQITVSGKYRLFSYRGRKHGTLSGVKPITDYPGMVWVIEEDDNGNAT